MSYLSLGFQGLYMTNECPADYVITLKEVHMQFMASVS